MRFEDAQFSVQREVPPQSRLLEPASSAVPPVLSRFFPPPLSLIRVIPDDPDYQKHVPLRYRLNAKALVGEVAQDISTRGKKAHFWIDLVHGGIVAAEIFAEASILVAGLAIAGPVLGLAGNLLVLGLPIAKAGQNIAARWAAIGFSRGVVMGADGRKARLVMDYFGNDYFPEDPAFPVHGRRVAMANYRMGLLVGYVQGRRLTKNQLAIFWYDLRYHMGNQSNRGSQKQWQRREWIDWYVEAAGTLRREHLV